MDDIVKAALAKWPNVPDCHGWLGLDARGDWYMRDDRCQRSGPFAAEPSEGVAPVKGSRLLHDKLIAFIGRNYMPDEQGRWFFQNGPQRVYVELEATPWIWRLQHRPGEVCVVASHTGRAARVRSCLLDEMGRVYLDTDLGFGLVHTQDVAQAAEAVEGEQWSPQDVLASELPERFGFVPSPQAAHRSPAMNLHIG